MTIPRKRTSRHSCPRNENVDEERQATTTNSTKRNHNIYSIVKNIKRKQFVIGGKNTNFIRTRNFAIFLFAIASCLVFGSSVWRGRNTSRNDAVGSIRARALTGNEFVPALEQDDPDEYFSACILWMDDNHRLEEWLAYHYYFLKLRYVVINVDPRSKTSPQEIADRWNGKNKLYNANNNNDNDALDYNLNMTVLLWNDTTYTDPIKYAFEMSKIQIAKGEKKYELATEYHKLRQPAFYKACTEHLISERDKQQQQQSASNSKSNIPSQWTAYFDTDEFFTFLPGTDRWVNHNKYETPGYVLRRLNAMKKEQILRNRATNEYEQQLRQKNSSMKQQKETHDTAHQQLPTDKDKKSKSTESDSIQQTQPQSGISCLVIPRSGIASVELTEEETNEMLLPSSSTTTGDATSEALVPKEFIREKLLLESSKTNQPQQQQNSDTSINSATNGTAIVRRFDTLRYKDTTVGLSTYGKSVLDLSQSDVRAYVAKPYIFHTHGVISPICDKEGANKKVAGNHYTKHYPLVHKEKMQLNHYVGSWESYNARPNDARKGLNSASSTLYSENAKSYENWLQKSKTTLKGTTLIRPWLQGFIRLVGGPKVAAHLLQDAGVIQYVDDKKGEQQ